MTHLLRYLTIAVCIVVSSLGVAQGSAQVATPVGSPVAAETELLDLAAMALDSTDVPPEMTLFYETYFSVDSLANLLFSGNVSKEEILATGLLQYYDSSYSTPGGSTRIRSYLQQYRDEESAFRGFDLFEDETRLVPDADFTDLPGPGIGEEPSEITIGSYASPADNAEPTTMDLTFRQGSILAGVTMEVGPESALDEQLLLLLAEALLDRIDSVLAGNPLPLIDISLGTATIDLGSSWNRTNEGYWSAAEVFGPEIDLAIVSGFVSGYFRGGAFDPNTEGAFSLPRAAVMIARFVDESSALLVLNDLEAAQPVFASMDVDPDLPSLPGASVALGFAFPNMFSGGDSIDSYRVVALSGTDLIFIDMQGNSSLESARAVTAEMAAAQLSCLMSNEPCDFAGIPSGLIIPSDLSEQSDPVV